MDFVKKNVMIVVSAVVAVIAIVVVFVIVPGFRDTLDKDTKASADSYRKANGLISSANFDLPFPGADGSPLKLPPGTFPDNNAIAKVNESLKQLLAVARQAYAAAVSANERPVLTQPGAQNVITASRFIATLDEVTRPINPATPVAPTVRANNLFAIMDAAYPVTNEEVAAILAGQPVPVPGGTPPIGGPRGPDDGPAGPVGPGFGGPSGIAPDLTAAKAAQLRAERFAKCRVYVMPKTFTFDPESLGRIGAEQQIQLFAKTAEYWIWREVAQGIAKTNNQARGIARDQTRNVGTSPVKVLESIVITSNPFNVPAFVPPQPGPDGQPGPERVLTPMPNPAVFISKNYAASVTGRTSNGLYDIARATITVIVDSRALMEFPETLADGNMASILSMSIASVDPRSLDSSMLFGEGNQQLVRMTLEVEFLFMREWTVKLMHPNLRKALAIADQPAPVSN